MNLYSKTTRWVHAAAIVGVLGIGVVVHVDPELVRSPKNNTDLFGQPNQRPDHDHTERLTSEPSVSTDTPTLSSTAISAVHTQ